MSELTEQLKVKAEFYRSSIENVIELALGRNPELTTATLLARASDRIEELEEAVSERQKCDLCGGDLPSIVTCDECEAGDI